MRLIQIKTQLFVLASLLYFVLCSSANAKCLDTIPVEQVNWQSYEVSNFQELSDGLNRPIMLFFHATDCTYCDTLRETVLESLVKNSSYRQKICFATMQMNSSVPIINFAGNSMAREEFLAMYKIRVSPTLTFLDPQGSQLVKSLEGLGNMDYYWFYLDEAIDDSIGKLHTPK